MPTHDATMTSEQAAVRVEPMPAAALSGEWIGSGFSVNVAYKAEQNGFLSVYTGGDAPAKGADLLTGKAQHLLETRTRAGGPYDGAVLPVAKGEYWLVKPQSPGSVFIQWRSDVPQRND